MFSGKDPEAITISLSFKGFCNTISDLKLSILISKSLFEASKDTLTKTFCPKDNTCLSFVCSFAKIDSKDPLCQSC